MIFGIQTMVFLVCFIILTQEWIQHRNRYKGLSFWVAMMICGFAGYTLIALRGTIPDFLSIIVANSLNILAFALFYTGLIFFFKVKAHYLHNIFIVITAILVFIYFTYINPSLTVRIITINITYIIIFSQALYLFICKIKTCQKSMSYIYIINISALIILNIYRTIMVFLNNSGNQDFFNQSIHEKIYFIINMIVMMYLMINLAMLVSRRLLHDIGEKEEKFNTIFHSAPYAALITEEETGIILEVNKEMLDLLGYERSEVEGRTVFDLEFYPDASSRNKLIEIVRKKGNISGIEYEFQRKDKTKIKTLFSSNSIKINDKDALISTMKDIEEIVSLREKLDYLATHDMLTGIPNRRYFHDYFVKQIDKSLKNNTRFVLAIFDIDGFKMINDKFGHDVGDTALKIVAERSSEFFKDIGFVARFGGDEFAILFSYADEEYLEVLKKFKEYVDSSDIGEYKYSFTISIGAAVFPVDSDDHDVLIKRADDALFYVKKSGKNGISFYSDINLNKSSM